MGGLYTATVIHLQVIKMEILINTSQEVMHTLDAYNLWSKQHEATA